MNFACDCGHVIHDVADFQAHKAHFVADQDWFDLLDGVDGEINEVARRASRTNGDAMAARQVADDAAVLARELINKLARTMYQCPECGQLFVESRGGTMVGLTAPHGTQDAQGILGSVHGEQWKGLLRGRWRSADRHQPAGVLWWQVGEDAGRETFIGWPELEERYHQLLKELTNAQRLRDAFLLRDGDVTHLWAEGS